MPSKQIPDADTGMSAPALAQRGPTTSALVSVLLVSTALVAWRAWVCFVGGASSAAGDGVIDLSLCLLCSVALLMLPAMSGTMFRSVGRGRSAYRAGGLLTTRPLLVASVFLTLGIVVQSLAPFVFVSNTDELHNGLRRSAGLLAPEVFGGSLNTVVWTCVSVADLTPNLILFLLLGHLAVHAGLERQLTARRALFEAGYQVVILAVVAGTLGVFVVTGQFSPVSIAATGLAGLMGTRLAAAIA